MPAPTQAASNRSCPNILPITRLPNLRGILAGNKHLIPAVTDRITGRRLLTVSTSPFVGRLALLVQGRHHGEQSSANSAGGTWGRRS
jgi:hypothetical protein